MHIRTEELTAFLSGRFNGADEIEHIGDGWWSQAFAFSATGKRWVIRISKHLTDFEKDIYAYTHFLSPQVPIPAILETGMFNEELYYCISEFIEGKLSNAVWHDPSVVLQPLNHIHKLDTSAMMGWGFTDANGNGMFESWEAYLTSIYNHKYPISWQELAERTWLDGALFHELMQKMKALFPYLPKRKKVLHGDYGFDNLLLSDNSKVTAVLDWAEMLLGDEMYDLVHMNEPWVDEPGEVNYMEVWKQGKVIDHFEQRLACYHIHYTLFHMHIHTVRGEEMEYRKIEAWAREHLL